MKFLDLFAGIGGFRLGMESAGHECIGFCEIDKFARASYKAIHNTEGEIELHDITTVTDEEIRAIGQVDVICGGFPCQAFSIAGARRGFEDTRGTLFFEIARFASILKPKYLFLENVKGLLNHDRGNTFKTILGALDGLGYDVEWQVLNSKNFSVPQNRERVFIIGHLRGQRTRRVFPIIRENEKSHNQQSKIEIVGNTKNPNGTSKGRWIDGSFVKDEDYFISDNVNKPSHYQGSKGLESIEVIDNFIGNLIGKAAWCWGNAIKYLLRFQKKNGVEDLKKARKNLDWLIEEQNHEN